MCLRREKCADHRSEEPSGRPVCLQVLSTISTVFNLPTRMNRELYICPMRWPQGGEAVLAGLRGDIMMCVCTHMETVPDSRTDHVHCYLLGGWSD